jgi:hypothetical protein
VSTATGRDRSPAAREPAGPNRPPRFSKPFAGVSWKRPSHVPQQSPIPDGFTRSTDSMAPSAQASAIRRLTTWLWHGNVIPLSMRYKLCPTAPTGTSSRSGNPPARVTTPMLCPVFAERNGMPSSVQAIPSGPIFARQAASLGRRCIRALMCSLR